MNRCPDAGSLLAFVSGQLSEAAGVELHAHLDGCAVCLSLLGDLLRSDDEDVEGGLRVGDRVGAYRIDRKLGQGAMGVVYLAEHETSGSQVALKVLRPEAAADPRLSERLVAEARLVNQIGHPVLVEIYDCLRLSDGRGAIVMEYLSGASLRSHLQARGGRLPEDEVRVLGGEVADALVAAHARGVVHRDIKPENLMLVAPPSSETTRDGPRVRLLDFGLARVLEADDGASYRLSTLTPDGEIVGTPAYLAPEQIEATGSVAGPADVYALGATLYHLLSGRPPFIGSSLAVLRAHLSESPPPLRALVPAISAALAELIATMLAKRPDARPSAGAVVGALLDQAQATKLKITWT